MLLKIIDILFSIFMTLLVYMLVPFIIALTKKKFKSLTLWIIAIANGICGFIVFALMHYFSGDDESARIWVALVWTAIGYMFLHKVSCSENAEDYEENLSKTEKAALEVDKSVKNSNPRKAEFCFENESEYNAYVKLHSDKDFLWVEGDKYISAMRKADEAFLEEDYESAIKICASALKCNPVGLRARFKMFDSYFILQSYRKAEIVLNNISKYLVSDADKAHFYSLYGNVECKLKRYEIAISCYQYSLTFEDDQETAKKLDKCTSLYKKYNPSSDPVDVLRKNEIPIIGESEDKLPEKQSKNSDDEKVQTEMHFCRKCGAELIDGAMFCNKCGTKVI